MGDEIYLDGERPITDIFEYVNKTKKLPKTSAVNEMQYKEHFNSLLKSYDAIIHISMASFASCSYNNAIAAANGCNNIVVIDSKSLSTGITLQCMKAYELTLKNKNLKEIEKEILNIVPKTQVSLILKSVNYLHKGGRCSGLQLFGANLLNLKPMVILDGKQIKLKKKYRGNMESVAKNYIMELFETNPNPNLENVFITYTSATPGMIEISRKLLKTRGFKNIYEATTNSTIACHSGEYAMGIIFLNN